MTKMVWIPVPRVLLVLLGVGMAAMMVKEAPAMMREVKILRM